MRALGRCFIESLRIYRHSSVRNCSVRVRFAPSPTGHLHLGGLRTALYNHLFCKKHGGKNILRIEDTDQTRLVEGATDHLIDILKWTGIEFDEGPHVGGNHGPYIQSERLDIYKKYCDQLLESKHAYRCFCTPERLELMRKHAVSVKEVPKYDNRCRHLSEDEVAEKMAQNVPYTIRFKLSADPCKFNDLVYGPMQYNLNEGDPIIMKSDGYPTYHFANIVDDHLMEITHVLRGVEWQISTPKHLMLYEAFGWKPPQYAHLPLLQNNDGKKLSKRNNDVLVDNYRALGFYPESVINLITNSSSGFDVSDVAGMKIDELAKEFNLSRLCTNSSQVDFQKINVFNKLHLKMKLDDEKLKPALVQELRKRVVEHYEKNLSSNECLEEFSDEYFERVLVLTQHRINMLSSLVTDEYKFLWVKPKAGVKTNETTNATQSPAQDISESQKDLVLKLIDVLSNESKQKIELNASSSSSSTTSSSSEPVSHSTETVESMTSVLKDLGKATPSIKQGQIMKLMRQALNGPKVGPSVAEIITFLGKEKTIVRLRSFLEQNNLD